jgi:TetR/AcrR family transcriptional regulator
MNCPKTRRLPGRRPKSGRTENDTRADILSAARSVFARRGLDGASVREVAAAARVNNAMIYYHFRDKVELYRAVLSDSFTAFDRIWEHEVFGTDSPAREKIEKYVEELIRFQHANDELRRILSMEFALCGRNLRWLAENLFDHSYQNLVKILKDGMRRGELKKIKPSVAIATLVGMVIHSFIMNPVAEYVSGRKLDLSVRSFGAFVTGMFFDGLTPERTGKNTRNAPAAGRTRRA